MARHRDIKIEDGKRVFLQINPDWDTLNELAKKVDKGDLSILDELTDLIVCEEETKNMMSYIDLAAKLGNDKARYVKAKELNDWNIKKLLLLREFAGKDILRAKYDYEQTRSDFAIFYGGLTIMALIGVGIAYMAYQFLK